MPKNRGVQFFHFCMQVCVYVTVCLYIAATKYLYSHQAYRAPLYAAFVSLAMLLLALHFTSAVSPIKPSLELPFPDSVPECP